MDNVSYQTSGALNRSHFALISKQEHALSSQEADEATWECFNAVKKRIVRPSDPYFPSSFGGLLASVRGLGLDIPLNPGWNSRQAREDLLLLLYCRESLLGGNRKISFEEMRFALPTALTLAEAGLTMEERRAGYLFCTTVIPPGSEMQLLLINTVRKDLDSTSIGRIILALNAIIDSPSPGIIPAISSKLEDLLVHRSSQVRRRVLHAFRTLCSLEIEILKRCTEYLPGRLKDPEVDVKLAALALMEICFENGYIDRDTFLNSLLEFLRLPRMIKDEKKSKNTIILAIKALQGLQKLLVGNGEKLGLDSLIENVVKLSMRGATLHVWSLLLESMRTLGLFPTAAIMSYFQFSIAAQDNHKHPLLFLRPLLASKDPNIASVLLQCLILLPVEVWAGPVSRENKGCIPSDDEPPSPSNIDDTELFGEAVEHEGPKIAAQEQSSIQKELKSLPPLFEEEEVGYIVRYLKSDDHVIRKLTIQVLVLVDPSHTGLIYQYLATLLSTVRQSVSKGVVIDPAQRGVLIVQALEIVEVTSADNPETYADSVTDILLQVDGENAQLANPGSPTPSSQSAGTSGSNRSVRSRFGVIDKAIEIVLIRAKSEHTFFKAFASRLLSTFVSRRVGDESVTLLVIAAAAASELEDISPDLAQLVFDSFSSFLSTTSLSIQETLLLSMLRMAAVDGVVVERGTAAIHELRQRSGRHLQNRCLQILDQMVDLREWRERVATIKPLNISGIVAYLEVNGVGDATRPRSKHIDQRSSNPGVSSQSCMEAVPDRRLRYTAYDTPSSRELKERHRTNHSRDLRADLFREKVAQSQTQRGYIDASDLIELTSDVNNKDRGFSAQVQTSKPPTVSRDYTNEISLDGSPFEVTPSSSLPNVSVPPFLPRNISPPVSPRLSSGRVLRSPPHSPLSNLTPRGSPPLKPSRLTVAEEKQDSEASFNVLWDHLGSLAGATTRGWFEGEASSILQRLKKVSGLRTVVLYHDGAETRLELRNAAQSGLMKLRQEEDNSTLWLLRCKDAAFQGIVKEILL